MGSTMWKVDGTHSQVGFSVKHMMFTTVRGRFTELEGTIAFDTESLEDSSVEVSIDVASLDTGVEDRDAHLKSADFFNAKSHPTLAFRSRRVEGMVGDPGDAFRVVGDLTVRGVSREVILDARFEGQGTDPWGGTRVGFSARTTIDRRDFGLTWNQALEAGGVLVGNEVNVELQVQAVRVEEPALAGVGAE